VKWHCGSSSGAARLSGSAAKISEQINVSGQIWTADSDVLNLTSSQVGQMIFVCQPLDLGLFLKDVASMGSQLLNKKTLSFTSPSRRSSLRCGRQKNSPAPDFVEPAEPRSKIYRARRSCVKNSSR